MAPELDERGAEIARAACSSLAERACLTVTLAAARAQIAACSGPRRASAPDATRSATLLAALGGAPQAETPQTACGAHSAAAATSPSTRTLR